MAKLYREYQVDRFVTDASQLPKDEYSTIGGVQVVTRGFVLVVGGWNIFHLVGVSYRLPANALVRDISELSPGQSAWGYSTLYVPDGTMLPSALDKTGGSLFNFIANRKDSVGFSDVTFDVSRKTVGDVDFGSFKLGTQDTVHKLAEQVADAVGLGGFKAAYDNATTVKNAVNGIVSAGLDIIEDGSKHLNDPNFDADAFNKRVGVYLRGSQKALDDALINLTMFPNNPDFEANADKILRGMQMVARATPSNSIPITAGVQLDLEIDIAGIITVKGKYTGTVSSDIALDGNDDGSLDGGDGNDFIYGAGGNDQLIGGNGNDALMGGPGNDTLFDSAGNNALDGGDGYDTAVFAGKRSDYIVTRLGSSITVSGLGTSSTLTSVDRIQFDDRAMVGDLHSPQMETNTLSASAGGSNLNIQQVYIPDTIDPYRGILSSKVQVNGQDITGVPSTLKKGWKVGTTADVNGDGASEIFFFGVDTVNGVGSGYGATWSVNGAGAVTDARIQIQMSRQGWEVAGAANVNGINGDEILWQNTLTGEKAIWTDTNGDGLYDGGFVLPGLGNNTTERILGVSDLDRDGLKELLLFNDATNVVIVYEGTAVAGGSITAALTNNYSNFTDFQGAAAAGGATYTVFPFVI